MRLQNQRIEFCDFLRAVSVTIVVFAHYIVGFSTLSNFLYNPNNVNDFYSFLWLVDWVDGAYGVAIFFLISGFLIPISLKKYGTFKFLVARFFRLVPTYSLCLICVILVSLIFGTLEYSHAIIINYLANITLFRDIIGGTIIDSVIWTLEMEAKFYFYLALVYFITKGRLVYCVLISLIFLLIPLLLGVNSIPNKYMAIFSYMFIGVSIHLICFEKKTNNFFWICIVIILLVASKKYFILEYGKADIFNIYLISFFVFVFVLLLNNYKSIKVNKLTKYIADISYPLYAVHVIGYPMISWLGYSLEFGQVAVIAAVISVIFISSLIHFYIEKPTIKFGKKITGCK
ncbi:acyltransferase [Zooshikella marina]|uniref:acyltransferase family protein n=1 Tax=Zooshikella ganghwensis TaxID=202772 RepID=UPI001BAF8D95|nr:acyltransferase [Zooshikella ganghwensis]MBU2704617.1 acyltransferase [Zooshikella ganghwensis]